MCNEMGLMNSEAEVQYNLKWSQHSKWFRLQGDATGDVGVVVVKCQNSKGVVVLQRDFES